jgi:hypothetical protein
MKTLSFYIVFHKEVHQGNTSSFSEESIKKYLKWVAVNEKISKNYPSWIPKECLMKEWEMKIHTPVYQMTNFYQNSIFLHLFWNKEYEKSKYIGFGQYDMGFDVSEFDKMDSVLKGSEDTVYGGFIYNFTAILPAYPYELLEHMFLKPYNTFYGTSHTFDKLKEMPLFLLHTFIIPSWFFAHMMPFIESNIPQILRILQWDTRHLAGTLERIFALCIACGMLEGKLRNILPLLGVKEKHEQRIEDSFRGISTGTI